MKKLSDEADFIFDVRDDFLFYPERTRIIGSAGYRILPGKSGLGYIESVAEEARFEGQCVRWIFTGKFLTHNPIYLLMMAFCGLSMGAFPLLFVLMSILASGRLLSLIVLLPIAPYVAAGIAILINVWRSINQPDGDSITGD